MNPRPRKFRWHIDAWDAPYGRIWAIQVGGQYLTAKHVECNVPTYSDQRTERRRQPRAWVWGIGVVRRRGSTLVINAR